MSWPGPAERDDENLLLAGHASCGDESHVADVIRQAIDGYLPA